MLQAYVRLGVQDELGSSELSCEYVAAATVMVCKEEGAFLQT